MQTDARLVAQRLNVPLVCLDGLDQLNAGQAAALRHAVEGRLSRTGNDALKKLSATSKLVPPKLAATIAESRMGPMMTAGMTSHMSANSAAKIAQRLSPAFLADVVPYLFGDSVAKIIALLPTSLAISVTQELDRRGDYLTIASLVEELPTDLVSKLMFAMSAEGMKAVVPLIRNIETVMNILISLPEQDQQRMLKLISSAW